MDSVPLDALDTELRKELSIELRSNSLSTSSIVSNVLDRAVNSLTVDSIETVPETGTRGGSGPWILLSGTELLSGRSAVSGTRFRSRTPAISSTSSGAVILSIALSSLFCTRVMPLETNDSSFMK